MMKDFNKIARLGFYLSKSYAADIFRLLNEYKDISSSEAASRLGLHIQTVQDFFDNLFELGFLKKNEIYEGKRPYFRYSYDTSLIEIKYDLNELSISSNETGDESMFIREYRHSGARFSTSRSGKYFSSVTITIGKARGGKQKKINLTKAQGQFLYNLPFPDASPLRISEILRISKINEEFMPEILSLTRELIEYKVIEKVNV